MDSFKEERQLAKYLKRLEEVKRNKHNKIHEQNKIFHNIKPVNRKYKNLNEIILQEINVKDPNTTSSNQSNFQNQKNLFNQQQTIQNGHLSVIINSEKNPKIIFDEPLKQCFETYQKNVSLVLTEKNFYIINDANNAIEMTFDKHQFRFMHGKLENPEQFKILTMECGQLLFQTKRKNDIMTKLREVTKELSFFVFKGPVADKHKQNSNHDNNRKVDSPPIADEQEHKINSATTKSNGNKLENKEVQNTNRPATKLEKFLQMKNEEAKIRFSKEKPQIITPRVTQQKTPELKLTSQSQTTSGKSTFVKDSEKSSENAQDELTETCLADKVKSEIDNIEYQLREIKVEESTENRDNSSLKPVKENQKSNKDNRKTKKRRRKNLMIPQEKILYNWSNEMLFKWEFCFGRKNDTDENKYRLWDQLDYYENGKKVAHKSQKIKASFKRGFDKKCSTLKKPIIFYSGGIIKPKKYRKKGLIATKEETDTSSEEILTIETKKVEDKDINFAEFVKYTNGIGLKILKKHGFKERLGLDENGRLNPLIPKNVTSRCIKDFFENEQIQKSKSRRNSLSIHTTNPEQTFSDFSSSDFERNNLDYSSSGESQGFNEIDTECLWTNKSRLKGSELSATSEPVEATDEVVKEEETGPEIEFPKSAEKQNRLLKNLKRIVSYGEKLDLQELRRKTRTNIKLSEVGKVISEIEKNLAEVDRMKSLNDEDSDRGSSSEEEAGSVEGANTDEKEVMNGDVGTVDGEAERETDVLSDNEQVSEDKSGYPSNEHDYLILDKNDDPFDLEEDDMAFYETNGEINNLKEMYRDKKENVYLNYNAVYNDEYFLPEEFRYKDQPIPRKLDPKLQKEIDRTGGFTVMQRPKDAAPLSKFEKSLYTAGWEGKVKKKKK